MHTFPKNNYTRPQIFVADSVSYSFIEFDAVGSESCLFVGNDAK